MRCMSCGDEAFAAVDAFNKFTAESVQDAFHWEHVKQEKAYPPGAVPYRVPCTGMENKNTPTRLSKIVANIKMNLKEFVHPVSVPFEPVEQDAIDDPADMDATMQAGDQQTMRDL